jgi:hypothetical protein
MSRIELDRQLEELRTAVLQMGEGVVASIDQALAFFIHAGVKENEASRQMG